MHKLHIKYVHGYWIVSSRSIRRFALFRVQPELYKAAVDFCQRLNAQNHNSFYTNVTPRTEK